MQVICCHWIADLVVLPSPRSLGFRGPMPPCFPFHFHADDETFWDVASEMTRRWPKTKATFNSQIVKIKSNSKAPAPCQASAISHQPSATNHQAASSNHWALSTAYIAYSTYVPYSIYAATTDIDIDPRTFHAPLTENKFAFASQSFRKKKKKTGHSEKNRIWNGYMDGATSAQLGMISKIDTTSSQNKGFY